MPLSPERRGQSMERREEGWKGKRDRKKVGIRVDGICRWGWRKPRKCNIRMEIKREKRGWRRWEEWRKERKSRK